MELVIFLTWLVLAIAVAQFAKSKGNSAVASFLLSLLLSPIIGLIVAAIAAPNEENIEEAKLESGTMRKCPACAELIKIEALVCRYCGRNLSTAQKPTQTSYSFLKSPAVQIWTKTGEEKKGPFSMSKLKELWDQGELTLDTIYWTEGMSEWRPVEELFQSLD